MCVCYIQYMYMYNYLYIHNSIITPCLVGAMGSPSHPFRPSKLGNRCRQTWENWWKLGIWGGFGQVLACETKVILAFKIQVVSFESTCQSLKYAVPPGKPLDLLFRTPALWHIQHGYNMVQPPNPSPFTRPGRWDILDAKGHSRYHGVEQASSLGHGPLSHEHHGLPCWWLSHPSEKYESAGMILPNKWKKNKLMFQSTKQLRHGSCLMSYVHAWNMLQTELFNRSMIKIRTHQITWQNQPIQIWPSSLGIFRSRPVAQVEVVIYMRMILLGKHVHNFFGAAASISTGGWFHTRAETSSRCFGNKESARLPFTDHLNQ